MEVITFNSIEFESQFANLSAWSNDYRFSAPFTRHRIYLPVVYGVLFIVGTLCNVWVVYVIACIRWSSGHASVLNVDFVPSRSTSPFRNNAAARNQSIDSQNFLRRSHLAVLTSTSAGRLSRTAGNVQVYIICLCCCDLIVLLFLLFLIGDLISGQWPVRSSFLCRAYLASESINKFCVPFLLVALSGYCYATIAECDSTSSIANKSISTKSINYKNRLNFKSPLVSAFFCLCAGFSLVIPVYLHGEIRYLISYNLTSEEVYWIKSKCSFNPPDHVFTIFTVYSFVCGYILPSILFTCFYSSVLRLVYLRAKRAHDRISPNQYRLTSVARTTMGLILFYWTTNSPYWFMNLYQYLHVYINGAVRPSTASVELAYFVHVLPYVNCTGYPIVYTLMNKNIKEAYYRIRLARKLARRRSDSCYDRLGPRGENRFSNFVDRLRRASILISDWCWRRDESNFETINRRGRLTLENRRISWLSREESELATSTFSGCIDENRTPVATIDVHFR